MSIKTERIFLIESGSPLVSHSLNQHQMKANIEGEQRVNLPRKVLRAIVRRERRLQEAFDCEREKQQRIWGRVQGELEGYDGTDYLVLQKEIDYLGRCGISVESRR